MLLKLRRTFFANGVRYKPGFRTPENRDGTEVPDDTWPLPSDAKVWDGEEWVDPPQPDYSHIKDDKDNKQHEAADKKAKDELATIIKDAKGASKKMRMAMDGFDPKTGEPIPGPQYDPSSKEVFAATQGNEPLARLAKVDPKAALDK